MLPVPGQSEPGSDGRKGVLCIPQSSSITGALPSDYLVSYAGNWLGESYPSAEKPPLYSTAPVDWTKNTKDDERTFLCIGYDTKLHIGMRLLFWRSGDCGVNYSLPLLPGPLSSRLVEPVRVLSIVLIGIWDNKPFLGLKMWSILKHWLLNILNSISYRYIWSLDGTLTAYFGYLVLQHVKPCLVILCQSHFNNNSV